MKKHRHFTADGKDSGYCKICGIPIAPSDNPELNKKLRINERAWRLMMAVCDEYEDGLPKTLEAFERQKDSVKAFYRKLAKTSFELEAKEKPLWIESGRAKGNGAIDFLTALHEFSEAWVFHRPAMKHWKLVLYLWTPSRIRAKNR